MSDNQRPKNSEGQSAQNRDGKKTKNNFGGKKSTNLNNPPDFFVLASFYLIYSALPALYTVLCVSGSWSSMVGSGENIQKLGLIPCAISWLYSAIERRREKTWTELTVSVSAIELCCGEEDTLRDLLGEVVPSSGSTQDSPKAHVRVQEDPVCGIQVQGKMGFGENITITFVI